jgi:hypothetical protein
MKKLLLILSLFILISCNKNEKLFENNWLITSHTIDNLQYNSTNNHIEDDSDRGCKMEFDSDKTFFVCKDYIGTWEIYNDEIKLYYKYDKNVSRDGTFHFVNNEEKLKIDLKYLDNNNKQHIEHIVLEKQ